MDAAFGSWYQVTTLVKYVAVPLTPRRTQLDVATGEVLACVPVPGLWRRRTRDVAVRIGDRHLKCLPYANDCAFADSIELLQLRYRYPEALCDDGEDFSAADAMLD